MNLVGAVNALFASEAKDFFPRPTTDDIVLFGALPDEFCLTVPYQMQTSISGSGSACLQMLCDYHGLDATPSLKLLFKSEKGWKKFNHETLAEDFIRVALNVGLLPYVYYPGRYVLPNFPEGYQGADFIARNISLISPFDRELMRAAIHGSRCPLFARIHFATDEYKMPEEMATILDTSGHALLLCGWNKEGFLVHDPWDKAQWGGYGGGEYRLLTYKRLTEMKPLVNCCLDEVIPLVPVNGFIRAWECSVFENRDMPIRFQLEVPKLPSYFYNYVKWDYEFSMATTKNVQIKEFPGALSYNDSLGAGNNVQSWSINTGPTPGSYPIDVTVKATGIYPVFPWETAKRSETKFAIERMFHSRLDIKRLDWLNKYART